MQRPRSNRFPSVSKICLVLTLLMVYALTYAPYSALSTQHPALAAGEGPALLLGVGDSLMAGVGASLPDERGEFALVADLMRGRFGPNLRAVDVAIPGETSTTFLAPKQPAPNEPTPVPITAQMNRA